MSISSYMSSTSLSSASSTSFHIPSIFFLLRQHFPCLFCEIAFLGILWENLGHRDVLDDEEIHGPILEDKDGHRTSLRGHFVAR